MKQGAQPRLDDATVAAQADPLVIQHGELHLGLQRVGLAHETRRVLLDRDPADLLHQLDQVAIRRRGALDEVVAVVETASLSDQVEAGRAEFVSRGTRVGAPGAPSQTAPAEGRDDLRELDAIAGIDGPRAEAHRRHHPLEHGIVRAALLVRAGLQRGPCGAARGEGRVARDHGALEEADVERRIGEERIERGGGRHLGGSSLRRRSECGAGQERREDGDEAKRQRGAPHEWPPPSRSRRRARALESARRTPPSRTRMNPARAPASAQMRRTVVFRWGESTRGGGASRRLVPVTIGVAAKAHAGATTATVSARDS